jgi:hypothetical protein
MCPSRADDIWLSDYLFLNIECLLCELMALVTCRRCHFVQASMSVVHQGMEVMSHLWITQLKKIMKNPSQVSQGVLGTTLLYTRQTACLSQFSESCSPSITSVCCARMQDTDTWRTVSVLKNDQSRRIERKIQGSSQMWHARKEASHLACTGLLSWFVKNNERSTHWLCMLP